MHIYFLMLQTHLSSSSSYICEKKGIVSSFVTEKKKFCVCFNIGFGFFFLVFFITKEKNYICIVCQTKTMKKKKLILHENIKLYLEILGEYAFLMIFCQIRGRCFYFETKCNINFKVKILK